MDTSSLKMICKIVDRHNNVRICYSYDFLKKLISGVKEINGTYICFSRSLIKHDKYNITDDDTDEDVDFEDSRMYYVKTELISMFDLKEIDTCSNKKYITVLQNNELLIVLVGYYFYLPFSKLNILIYLQNNEMFNMLQNVKLLKRLCLINQNNVFICDDSNVFNCDNSDNNTNCSTYDKFQVFDKKNNYELSFEICKNTNFTQFRVILLNHGSPSEQRMLTQTESYHLISINKCWYIHELYNRIVSASIVSQINPYHLRINKGYREYVFFCNMYGVFGKLPNRLIEYIMGFIYDLE